MALRTFLLAVALPSLALAQGYKSHTRRPDGLSIQLTEGVLSIQPLSDKAFRVQWQNKLPKEAQELVLIKQSAPPLFRTQETPARLTVSSGGLSAVFDKRTCLLQFRDKAGKLLLSEQAGSRKLVPSTVQGEACYIAQQGFQSPADEFLFGLGQFQDGHYNLRNISRKLIQVNTQIAIPFLYSSKGYGILWHQYGLTEFNPADQAIALGKKEVPAAKAATADATTAQGTQRVSQQQAQYEGSFTVPKAGEYCLMLDLGDMDNRHLVVVDDVPLIDQANYWLPPAVSKLTELGAGRHTVRVVCKASNTPTLRIRQADNTTTFHSPNAKSLDYLVFAGQNADEILGAYRDLTGKVPLLPRWAYGFWQCRERYSSSQQLVETVREFRQRNLPLDVIVQDWQYWGKYGWGVPKFDETNYPDPAQFIGQLHEMKAQLAVSVWENVAKESEVAKPYVAQNLYLPNSPWIDIFNPETRKVHWAALNQNLFRNGVDGWWMDATEPENDALRGTKTYFGPGDFYRLTYPLFVSKAVYEGQRQTNPAKRVAILIRSAFAGQQRYGTINWSGDIGCSWDTYRRQLVAGLNYSLTGMPYWTTDIGGFFRPGPSQYTDEHYHELLTRWFEWGALNPIFRSHGYQTETEPWKYGPQVEANMKRILNLRYQLLPYIYSEAWGISARNSTLMRPLVMDFQADPVAVGQAHQYMFGKALLVAPVTEPGVTSQPVYLPKASGWFNFWTGQYQGGGQTVNTAAPLAQIPLFVKAGSILPIGKVMQYTAARQDTLDIRVYGGADATFSLYEDEGDGYDYEKGNFALIPFKWDEKSQQLAIDNRRGTYPGQVKNRVFRIAFLTNTSPGSSPENLKYTTVAYTGNRLVISRQ